MVPKGGLKWLHPRNPLPQRRSLPPNQRPPLTKSATTKATAAKTAVAKAKPNPGKVETEVKTKMKTEFANMKDKAAGRAREAAESGKDKASEALEGFGKILRDSAEQIDEKVGAQYGDYARKAADAVDDLLAKWTPSRSTIFLKTRASSSARARAIAIGAAAAIGFVLARLVRSGRD
jgi:hypothetical protein